MNPDLGLNQGPFEPIAIIGMSCLFPDASTLTDYWSNLLSGRTSIQALPPERWSVEDHWTEGGPGNVPEGRTYAKIGAFVNEFEFNWRRWRVPPATLGQIDPCQQWAVETAAAALEDAGLFGENIRRPLPGARTGVVFANALGGENRNLSNLRVWGDRITRIAQEKGLAKEHAQSLLEAITAESPRVDEQTMPGELANVVAGRVANLLDLQGPNHTTDAACATTMAALLDAARMLQSRQVDLMVCGASDRTMDPATFAKFSAIGALSATHSRPFDASANGFVMGEGAGCLVLARLDDAIAHGDRIHAVIRGIGASSDGRGKGITAPSIRGQQQAILRAYQQAGFSPKSVDLVEAHGTSTSVGDATELGVLSQIFGDGGRTHPVAVGSVKSNIGHLKAAAGMAGIIKAVLSIENQIIPPSCGFENPNSTIDWDTIPLCVPTTSENWQRSLEDLPRRAQVSAFGFGGTNWVALVEEWTTGYHHDLSEKWQARWNAGEAAFQGDTQVPKMITLPPSVLDPSCTPTLTHEELLTLEGGVLLLTGPDPKSLAIRLSEVSENLLNGGPIFDDDPTGRRLSIELAKASDWDLASNVRMALIATSWEEFRSKTSLAITAVEDREKWSFLDARLIHISDSPVDPHDRVVHQYPGQGSQWVGMTKRLSQRYSGAADVWLEADKTMVDILGGETISSFVLRTDLAESELAEAEAKLKRTEYTQPAMLTADLAIDRVFEDHGLVPDMVAGHSLGEYGALMRSGIMDMHDALRAAAARGTKMGSVDVPDEGLMASVTAPIDSIREVLESTSGYVIAANENSPMMTVIAGETKPMRKAIATFESLGAPVAVLQTSHAFHSKIVEPASGPLKEFLKGLDLQMPSIPITSNFNGGFYPQDISGYDGPQSAILPQLAPQMASPVKWTSQIEAMYTAGARIFVEVGPKRALTMFASQTLADRPHLAIMSNHPKIGDLASFLSAWGRLALAGRPASWPDPDSSILSEAFRAGPIGWDSVPTVPSMIPVEETPQIETSKSSKLSPNNKSEWVASVLSIGSGYPASMCIGNANLRHDLGMSHESINLCFQKISTLVEVDARRDPSLFETANEVIEWVTGPVPSLKSENKTPLPQHSLEFQKSDFSSSAAQTGPYDARILDPYVVSGVSLGLPGLDDVFDPDAIEKIVGGMNLISELPPSMKDAILDKRIVRLVKGEGGEGRFVEASGYDDIPQLAGMAGRFDLSDWGVDQKMIDTFDISTRLAIAAGYEAVRDAGIPLVPVEQIGRGGKRLVRRWILPKSYGDRTGVIFASCFPGLQQALDHAATNGDDGEGRFDRRYLFQVLTMGHSQFAQLIGARGANAHTNNACASGASAFAIAEDWLATERCDRVIIITADEVTHPTLMPWIGSGFASSGAAATGRNVKEVALPFDVRRNGLVLGMGAAAFVLERKSSADHRGVSPYVELLGAEISNSAFHGTRLDVEHVADNFDHFVSRMESRWNLDRHGIASRTVFMSHETYTPKKGGSADAEIQALRRTFGESASNILIANTKGFTGHPQAPDIENAVAVYGLVAGRFPPVANLKERDPDLGQLRLSEGGSVEADYAIRFAAGFGSQIAITMFRRLANDLDRIDRQKLLEWVKKSTGATDVDLRILDRRLVAFIDADENLIGFNAGTTWQKDLGKSPVPDEPADSPKLPHDKIDASLPIVEPTFDSRSPSLSKSKVQDVLLNIVVEATGYPAEFIEFDQDLEGSLGIDTVRQAEILAAARQELSLPEDPDFSLSQTPTLDSIIDYAMMMLGDSPISAPTMDDVESKQLGDTEDLPFQNQINDLEHLSSPFDGGIGDEEIRAILLEIVVEATGYPEEFIEWDQDLEGSLGIDTVRQAEILAAAREKLSLPDDPEFSLAQTPTLDAIVSYAVQMLVSDNPNETQESPSTEISSGPQVSVLNEVPDWSTKAPDNVISEKKTENRTLIRDTLLNIVIDVTGYPEEFIEWDADLEGSLGIDTVRQAEILGAARAQLSLPDDSGFTLAQTPTLDSMIEYAVRMSRQSSQESHDTSKPIMSGEKPELFTPPLEVPSPSPDSISHTPIGVRTWSVETENISFSDQMDGITEGSHVVLIDDPFGLTRSLSVRLESLGAEVSHLFLEPGTRQVVMEASDYETVIRFDPCNVSQVRDACQKILKIGKPSVLIDAGPLHLIGRSWPIGEGQDRKLDSVLGAGLLFEVLRNLGPSIVGQSGRAITISALDGAHGHIGSNSHPMQAASAGILGSWAKEVENVMVRHIDLEPELIIDLPATARKIIEEISHRNEPAEIGLGVDGTRRRFTLHPVDGLPLNELPVAGNTILVTGGGGGITSACIVGLANHLPYGVRFVITGRTSPEPDAEKWLDDDEGVLLQRKTDLRKSMLDQANRRGESAPTIVQWEGAWSKLQRSLEIYRTLSTLRKAGHDAEYHSLDVTDGAGIDSLIRQLGAVSLVIHGAGIEESRFVSDKPRDRFDLCLSIKIDGLRNILNSVSSRTRIIAFTSIAGRFFNAGQADYSAANRVLDTALSQLPRNRGLTLAWTGWREVGMATRGSLEKIFESAGLEMVGLTKGVSQFVDAVGGGLSGPHVVCGSLGSMDVDDCLRLPEPDIDNPSMIDPPSFAHMLGPIEKHGMDRLTSYTEIIASEHPYLVDHAVGDRQILPGVMGIEMMAQAAMILRPELALLEIRNASFLLPVSVSSNPLILEIIAEIEHIGDNVTISTRVESKLRTKDGRVFDQPRIHHSASMIFGPVRRSLERLRSEISFSENSYSSTILNSGDIYREGRMFHGPRFQVVSSVNQHAGQIMDATLHSRTGLAKDPLDNPISRPFVSLPMQVEAAFQVAGLLMMSQQRLLGLPVSIGSIYYASKSVESSSLYTQVWQVEHDGATTVSDAILFDLSGKKALILDGIKLKAMAELDGPDILP